MAASTLKLSENANRLRHAGTQAALAWPMAQKPWIAPIPVTTKLARLQGEFVVIGL